MYSAIKIMRCDPNRSFNHPIKGSLYSAAWDLHLSSEQGRRVEVGPLARVLVGTNVAMELKNPALILSRSGNAVNYGLIVLNAPGLIDADYRGELQIALYNTNPTKSLILEDGDRVAQILMIANPMECEFLQTDALAPTERGSDGFGSTGD